AAVLAFEVPHVLKKSGGSSSAPPAATTTATDTSGTTAPTPSTATGTAAAAAVPVSSTKLTSSDVAPRRLKSQLYSFSHFSGKDPFVQQVTAASITNSPSTGASSGSSGTGASGAAAAPAPQTYSRTLARTGAATIQVNGKLQTVRIGASFPSSNPLFTLVSLAHGVARIGIASGSYASGSQPVPVARGRWLA